MSSRSPDRYRNVEFETVLLDLLIRDGIGNFKQSLDRHGVYLFRRRNGIGPILHLREHAAWKNISAVRISCLTGEGLTELENAILSRISDANLCPENTLAINMRHCNCLRRALGGCDRARKTLDETPSHEYLSVDLNEALAAVGEVIGTVGVEEILDSIFDQFCIGK